MSLVNSTFQLSSAFCASDARPRSRSIKYKLLKTLQAGSTSSYTRFGEADDDLEGRSIHLNAIIGRLQIATRATRQTSWDARVFLPS